MKTNSLVKSALGVLCLVLFVSGGAYAQWSSDSLLNLGVAVVPGDQATPKMAATSDGGCYITWFDNRNGNYCVYLQRLDSLGEFQWTPNGILVSGHPQQSWLVDWDMTVDQNDNAVIVFTDVRNGGTNDLDVFAYKIAPDSIFVWGPDGVGLSEPINTDFEAAPKVTATSEGNFVVGWFKSGDTDRICFQKISAAGQKMWGDNGITFSGAIGEALSAPDLTMADGDSVIAFWKNSTGPPWAPTTYLYTQKFDPDGNYVWGAGGQGVLIYDLGNMSAWTYPSIYPDNHGGAFYTWYDGGATSFNVWVQHVDRYGNLVFPVNGIQASTNSADRLHMNPSLSYLPNTDELFVFWVEENFNQSMYGIYGQKFSPTGDRLWTDSGHEFIGLGGNQIWMVRSEPTTDSTIYIGYFESPTTINTAVKAFRIDTDGMMLWNPRVLSSADLGSKDDLLMVVNTEDRAFLSWHDDRNDDGDIYAQNVNPDGSLGNPVSVVNEPNLASPECFVLHPAHPNPFNPTTTIAFQLPKMSVVTLKVYNVLGQEVMTIVERQMMDVGRHQILFDGSGLVSGLYFYRLQAGEYSDVGKMVLMK